MAVNVYGTLAVTNAVLPLLRKGSHTRIVNVCSQAGRLGQVSPALQAQFKSEHATSADVCALVESFLKAVADGDYAEKGWPRSMYGVSKLAEIALTFATQRELLPAGVAVNAVCPGWCSTAMSSYKGPRSAEKGAETPVWLATREGSTADITGGFWFDLKQIDW